jgi:hypothetical protein
VSDDCSHATQLRSDVQKRYYARKAARDAARAEPESVKHAHTEAGARVRTQTAQATAESASVQRALAAQPHASRADAQWTLLGGTHAIKFRPFDHTVRSDVSITRTDDIVTNVNTAHNEDDDDDNTIVVADDAMHEDAHTITTDKCAMQLDDAISPTPRAVHAVHATHTGSQSASSAVHASTSSTAPSTPPPPACATSSTAAPHTPAHASGNAAPQTPRWQQRSWHTLQLSTAELVFVDRALTDVVDSIVSKRVD